MAIIKNKAQRKALIRTLLLLALLILSGLGLVYWASFAGDSEFARSIRQVVGIPGPAVERPPPPPSPPPVRVEAPLVAEVLEAEPEPEAPAAPGPEPLPVITFSEICARPALWPKTLQLTLSKRVYIRYNGNVYGYMQFSGDMPLHVDALGAKGEVFGWIDGNYLSFLPDETNFEEWFRRTHGERYDLRPVEVEPARPGAEVRHKVGTPQGDADFWTEMRIWCQRNYDSISLQIEQDTLVFRWLPKEDAPIDYSLEAREIARNFLLKRSARGSNENYAACEIRHPVTGELLGASSIFIPRL